MAATQKVTPQPQQMPQVKPTKVELTAKQRTDWETTRAAMLWHCPAFSHIFITMMANGKDMATFTKDVPIAATDGKNLLLNPDTFFNYNLYQRVFICAHEIMHCIFDHCGHLYEWQKTQEVRYPDGSRLPYDGGTMNKAMDLVINDLLITDQVGEFNKDWLHDPSVATAKDSVIDAYKKCYKQGKGGKGGQPGGGQGFDQHLAPGSADGQNPQDAQSQRNPQEWKAQVAAAAAAAKAQGKLPGNLERLFGEVLEPKVDWREHIKSLFARRLGSGNTDWRRPNRRLIVRDIYAPGKTGFGCGTVVVGVDTSGSIGPRELDMFLAEVSGILEDVQPKNLYIMWCDAHVHRVDECDEPQDLNVIRAQPVPGGGGTSFIPVFEKIEELGIEPEALVYLTDGMGSFPAEAPRYPVIWGSIYEPSQYPFGDVVQVPKQA
jgi:predicted metal-dependent peptidase